MGVNNVSVAMREEKGKGYNRRLREKGIIPAVIYGKGAVDVSIELPERELRHILKSETGRNSIINLQVHNQQNQVEEHTVMIRDVQQDPVKGMMLHADFYQIALNEKLTTEVPVSLVGACSGVKKGGVLQQNLRQLEVECLPTQIPETIEVDVTNLEIGQRLTVADIPIQTNVRFLEPDETTVVAILTPRMAEVAPEVEPAQVTKTGVEPVEGEADTKSEEA